MSVVGENNPALGMAIATGTIKAYDETPRKDTKGAINTLILLMVAIPVHLPMKHFTTLGRYLWAKLL